MISYTELDEEWGQVSRRSSEVFSNTKRIAASANAFIPRSYRLVYITMKLERALI